MAKELSAGKPFDLSELDNQVFAWRKADKQPHLIDIEGQLYVAIFEDRFKLKAVMAHLGITDYAVTMIMEGNDFIASLTEAGVKACFNVYVAPNGALRYTDIRLDWEGPPDVET